NCIPHDADHDFAPAGTLVFEVPFVQAIKGFFGVAPNAGLAINLPSYVTWLTQSDHIQTTPRGYIDMAFTFSLNTDTQTFVQDALRLVGQEVSLFYKHGFEADVSTILAGLKVVLDIGDATLSVITNDLEDSNSLKACNNPNQTCSYTLFDFSHLQDVVSKLVDMTGIGIKIYDIVEYVVHPPDGVLPTGGANLLSDAR